jgi:SNF family Na+-dependent transporter
LILAAAGNAVGIGNLLRFPGQAAQNGGGAFLVPYVVSLLVFGLPMMWVAWMIGRHGGKHGHGSLPGQFEKIWPHPAAKFVGVIGVALPLVFCLYYTYIEAWCLGYAYLSATRDYVATPERAVDLQVYLGEFLGDAPTDAYFSGQTAAFTFLLVTVALNVWVLYRGVAKGIETLAKIAMPLLFLFCLVMAVRVFTLEQKAGTAWDGLNFLWTPNFEKLADPAVWIAAAGQIFFTLSIGFGSMECYASYLKETDDVTLTGLTTAATNEFVEVVFGSLIAIPAAAIFFGAGKVGDVASSGTFAIGMVSMPEILRNTAGIEVFGTIWFLLLFFAAFTSSVAVAQPVVAFLQDELKMKRETAAMLIGFLWLLGTVPVIWFYKYGVLDEMDFWAGTIGLVVCAGIEAILIAWVFGMKRAWDEMHRGAELRVPRVFYFVIQYVTPVALLAIFGGWFYDAIRKDSLIPGTKISWGVARRDRYPGEFRLDKPRDPEKKEFDALQDAVKKAVGDRRIDLTAWAEVETDAQGAVKVTSFGADPALKEVLDAAKFERWLSLQKWRYELGGAAAPVQATIAFEALHTAPFIWLTRVIMIGMTLLFLVLIAVAWRGRPAPAPAGLSPEAAANGPGSTTP